MQDFTVCYKLLFSLSAYRMEEFVYDKLDKKNTRMTNTEYLGEDMISAGQEFGSGTSYGLSLH
jgi:endophilin-B